MNKIILILTIVVYSVVVSQSFMYMLSLKNTQMALGGSSYTEVRQLIDANMMSVFKYVMYAALLLSFGHAAIHARSPRSLQFITSAVAFIALVVDAILTLKGNVPLNEIINSWAPGNFPENWKEIRNQWFVIFQYRQIVNITGFISLLVGTIFGDRNFHA